ncbi:MAG: hypothetical protein AAFV26_11865, partial [Pseudomonadota bacterium]
MALDFAHDTCRRTTSTLNEAVNDTGRTAFCGPIVVSAVAGVPVSEVEAAINASRGLDPARKRQVVGTYAEDVEGALAAFGYDLSPVDTFLHLERKERPTLWSWMQKPRSAWAHYLLGIHKGREGHWVLIKGVKLCDTF